jgi:dTMP kinase
MEAAPLRPEVLLLVHRGCTADIMARDGWESWPSRADGGGCATGGAGESLPLPETNNSRQLSRAHFPGISGLIVMTRGVFLSLDGLDGTGKSTQCRMLADWLRARGHAVVQCADPGGTAVGDVVRALLLGHRGEMSPACEAFLFMASRAQLTAEVIRPALDAGQVVLSDRYLLANAVYQGHAGGLDPEKLWEIGRLSSGGLEPDLTLVLDLTPAEAARRRGRPADRLEGRAAEYQERVREGFRAEARRRPDRIRVVDAAGPVEEVHAQICREVARVMAAGPRA